MIEKIIVVAPTTAVPISTGFAVALNVLPAPSFSSRCILGRFELRSNPKFFLMSPSMPGISSIMRQFVDRLRVVGHRTIGVHRDRHRAHAQEAERHQTEGEHGRGQHQTAQAHHADTQ